MDGEDLIGPPVCFVQSFSPVLLSKAWRSPLSVLAYSKPFLPIAGDADILLGRKHSQNLEPVFVFKAQILLLSFETQKYTTSPDPIAGWELMVPPGETLHNKEPSCALNADTLLSAEPTIIIPSRVIAGGDGGPQAS